LEKLSIIDLKKIELEVLISIDKICRDNDIKYFLFGGTLLGAIRHKGYIPWDDDIDICMLREDYDKFRHVIEFNNPDIYFLCVENSEDYVHPFGKVCSKGTLVYEPGLKKTNNLGVFVDIFPFDEYGNSHFKRKILNIRMYINHKFRWLGSITVYVKTFRWFDNIPNYLGYLYANIFGAPHFAKKIDKLATKYNDTNSLYLVNSAGHLEVFEKSIFESTCIADFEGVKFPIPIGYDKCLRILYGNYMELPRVEERIHSHDLNAYRI
jgi:lipopolysaccharide cholinephosphotransferase